MFVNMIQEFLGTAVRQDPQEMIWIEKQQSIFFLIFMSLLFLWVLKDLSHLYARERNEELVRQGMISLFSLDGNLFEIYHKNSHEK